MLTYSIFFNITEFVILLIHLGTSINLDCIFFCYTEWYSILKVYAIRTQYVCGPWIDNHIPCSGGEVWELFLYILFSEWSLETSCYALGLWHCVHLVLTFLCTIGCCDDQIHCQGRHAMSHQSVLHDVLNAWTHSSVMWQQFQDKLALLWRFAASRQLLKQLACGGGVSIHCYRYRL